MASILIEIPDALLAAVGDLAAVEHQALEDFILECLADAVEEAAEEAAEGE